MDQAEYEREVKNSEKGLPCENFNDEVILSYNFSINKADFVVMCKIKKKHWLYHKLLNSSH